MAYIDLQRNVLPFNDVVQGNFGRKIAYVDAESVNRGNVLSILSKCIGIFNENKSAIRYLWRYKKGDQPILYREKLIRDDVVNKIVENHAYEIVQYENAQTYGEPIQYVSQSEKESVNEAVDKFNDYMKNAFKYQRNISQGEWKSAVGTSFLAIQRTGNSDRPFRITVPSPINTFVIYSSYTDEPLMAVQELKDVDGNQYYLCFSDTYSYKIQNGKIAEEKLHAFGGIPIVEIPNNQDRLSSIEIVIELLDAINNMQSDRMDAVDQFIQAFWKFVNCEIDKDTFEEMKKMGAFTLKSNNGDNKADADLVSQELDQTQTQVAKDDLWDNAQAILAIPNRETQSSGGDTQGAVTLRAGWDFAKQRAKLKDAYVIEAEKRFADVALNILRVAGKGLDITTNDFEVNIPHSPQDNMSVKANVLSLLLQAGIHPLIAIKVSGLWSDSEKVYLLSKPYLDVLYKTIDEQIENIQNADEQLKNAQKLADQYTKQQENVENQKA